MPHNCTAIPMIATLFLFLLMTQSHPARQSNAPAPLKQTAQSDTAHSSLEGATSTSPLALPFKKVWEFLTDGATSFRPLLDQERIYVALTGGRVIALERKSGALVWTSELGGQLTAAVAADEKALYVATRKVAEEGSATGGVLRALDKATGLTLWARDWAQPFASALTVTDGRLYAGSEDGGFYAMATTDGETLWRVATQDVVRSVPLITGSTIYFGSNDGSLRGVEPTTGKEVLKFQTAGKVIGQPALAGYLLYFGSADGWVYAVDVRTCRLHWKSRTGAAIEAGVVVTQGRLLVASLDNFVYALRLSTGDRQWKRRFINRINATPLIEGDAVLIAPMFSNQVFVLLIADGRPVNYYDLEKGYEITAAPVFTGDGLVVATDKGLIFAVASPGEAVPATAKK